jgi:VWFA-related protein
MRKRILSTLLMLIFVAPTVCPQPSPQQPATPKTPQQEQEETVRIGTTVVHIDLIVTDKTGRRVTGLNASDFQVTDEGEARLVDYFAAIEGSRVARKEDAQATANNSGTAAGGAAAAATNAATTTSLASPFPGRYVALVVDDQNLSAENLVRSRRALSDYVGEKLAPSDLVALIATGESTAASQQFTNDHLRLLSAISRVGSPNGPERKTDPRFKLTAGEAVRINRGDEQVLEAVARRVASQSIANETTQGSLAIGAVPQRRGTGDDAVSLTPSDTSPTAQLHSQIRNIAQARIAEIANEARRTMQTLASLFEAMAELPGRKVVVLLTESFSTLTNTSDDLSNDLTQLIEKARRSGVSVYGLDAGGLRTNNTTASEHTTGADMRAREIAGSNTNFSDFENLEAVRVLVNGTGGTLFANTNDITSGIERAVEDASSYYVVGFHPGKLDNKFHKLTVTVKGKPDLLVRTRRGYLAVNQETARGTNAELAAALLSPVPRMELPLEVVANVAPQGGEQVVLTGLHIGRNYLSLPLANAPEQKASYEVVAWVFQNGIDKPVGVVSHTVAYDLVAQPADRQKLSAGGFTFVPQPFKLAPGRYQIRAVVREQSSGAVGSAYQFFEVPDLTDRKEVSASSVLLNEAGKTGFGGANSFKRGSEADVRYIVYNLPKDSAELIQRVRLIDAQGKALLDSPLSISANADASSPNMFPQATRLKLPPARGRYALIVNLQDKKGKVDIERRADFVVE